MDALIGLVILVALLSLAVKYPAWTLAAVFAGAVAWALVGA